MGVPQEIIDFIRDCGSLVGGGALSFMQKITGKIVKNTPFDVFIAKKMTIF